MQVNPDIQVLALSATIGNVDEIAGWLNAKYIVTEWRPVSLKEGIILNDEIQYKDGGARKIEHKTDQPTVNLVLSTLKTGGQALVFASTRRNSVSAAKIIAQNTSDCNFQTDEADTRKRSRKNHEFSRKNPNQRRT